ncbi:MAG: 4Fe-4S dicluster-binding protein [Anaerolineales bacterium]
MSILGNNFLGMDFDNPFFLTPSPLTADSEKVIEAFRIGWGGVVMQTIGESPPPNSTPREKIIRSGRTKWGVVDHASVSRLSLDQYTQEIDKIRNEFPDRPLITSIFGGDDIERWQEIADKLEPHKLSAIEIDTGLHSFASEGTGLSELGQDLEGLGKVVSAVRESTTLPVIVKLSPNVTDIVMFARTAREAGADGFTATSGLLGVGGIDPETLLPMPSGNVEHPVSRYHGAGLRPVALRWTANLAKELTAPIFGCGGVAVWQDAAEFLSVGASAVQVGSAAEWNGIQIIDELNSGLEGYLERRSFNSVKDVVGKALPNIVEFSDLDLDIQMVATIDESRCTGCNVCVRACADGGFQAIHMEDKIAHIDVMKCDGCGLCIYVCPPDIVQLVPKDAHQLR